MRELITVGMGGEALKDLLDEIDLVKLIKELTEEAESAKGQRKRKRPMSWRGGSITALLLFVFYAAPTLAHPAHTTVSEVEFNAETGHLEVALRVMSEDLEKALSKRENRNLVVERESAEKLEELCAAYLSEAFRLEPGNDSDLEWVGLEFEERDIWLYFELPVNPIEADAVLVVELLMEIHSQHLNTVHIRSGGFRRAVIFSTDSRFRALQPLINPSKDAETEQ